MRSRHPSRATRARVAARGAATGPRIAARLAGAVLGAAGIVAALESALLTRAASAARWRALDLVSSVVLLGSGALLVVPLALALGGWRLARQHAQALRELSVDDLTGVLSRRAFGADLPDAVRDANDQARPLTLALVELAGVPASIDLLGRRRTEALVGAAATTLAGAPAGSTATYRLAGELFAVVLPGVGPEAAFEVVDHLLGNVARAAAPLAAGAGLCSLDARCPDAQLLLVGASAALDEARALGPGRVVASADEQSGLRWLATPGTTPG